ncbi:RNA-binding domain-containing protein [Natranaerobius thermophilus]|uniref:Putative transcriptional regulator n=1 Tax=Natranaerobius thermophilus (strain ATCC BAA-1301 / DSM 18059 / JW/NM-WN-LF) TaxID=457570 RepID=B2A4W0_NATTJ|nr:RNA-binding domain-containing protein [Natranaerobius thermophilus]ACB83882.1 putative transcriptional regulator [Natranaerobius thermophilus JW/NM-WN-LF]
MENSFKQTEFLSLSTRAQILLSREEGFDVEFKQTLNAVDSEDIVAFANSKHGGAILAGIREEQEESGRQGTEIVGCPIGDEEKLTILNKAASCHPPVYLELYIENSQKTPFYRIEIPSGKEKPYCTPKGTYKIRGDGRTNVLLPDQLLSLFVEEESEQFIGRFKEATKELEKSHSELQNAISGDMRKFLENFYGEFARKINKIESIEDRMESLENKFDKLIKNLDLDTDTDKS